MWPSALLKTAQNHKMMVELKNGETYSGLLVSIDHFMNMHLRDVYQIDVTGEDCLKIPDCYIRGSSVKYRNSNEDIICGE